MPQTLSAKVVNFRVPAFYRMMQELSKGNDELTFVTHYDKLVIKTKGNTLNILITLSQKIFDSFQIDSPKVYTISSRSIRDIFSKVATNLTSLRIIIEESDDFSGREDLKLVEEHGQFNQNIRSFVIKYLEYLTLIKK